MVTRERRLDRARATADRAVREVGRQLREARFAAGLSLRELSDAVGISRSELSRIELGKSPQVPVRTLVIVAALLGIDLSVRGFPAGDPIRDAGQLRLIGRFRTALPPALSWRSEVPIDAPGDMRAWDGVITAKGWQAAVEAETRLQRCAGVPPAAGAQTPRRPSRDRHPAACRYPAQPAGRSRGWIEPVARLSDRGLEGACSAQGGRPSRWIRSHLGLRPDRTRRPCIIRRRCAEPDRC